MADTSSEQSAAYQQHRCGAWGPDTNGHVRCHLPEGHAGMHRSDYADGSRRRWEPVNFDPFAHTGGGYGS